jgi:hypothetical protein
MQFELPHHCGVGREFDLIDKAVQFKDDHKMRAVNQLAVRTRTISCCVSCSLPTTLRQFNLCSSNGASHSMFRSPEK